MGGINCFRIVKLEDSSEERNKRNCDCLLPNLGWLVGMIFTEINPVSLLLSKDRLLVIVKRIKGLPPIIIDKKPELTQSDSTT